MESINNTGSIDRAKVEAVLAKVQLPPEILRVEVQYEPDYTGDPAVYLRFILPSDIDLNGSDITRLSAFASQVLDGLYNANIGGFAYSRLQQAA